MPSNQTPYDILEIRFKNSRKAFYRNAKNLPLNVGDVVVVEVGPGYDIGVVSVVGELARIQVKKKEVTEKPGEMKKILRVANQEDIDKWIKARSLESEVMFQARTLAVNLGLEMKISDVEYQGDLTKATFYYTAEGRVDFRQLIKDMADKFKIRIEMRQIGSRQEAQRLGGIGSCGRELCCSTWLTDFRSVSTSAARYQQLSLNPQKLAGQCGKLKCCLNYELDSYLDAIKGFPSADVKIHTEKGSAFHIKTDVFKRQMWFLYEGGAGMGGGLVALTPERVKDIQQMNKNGKKPLDLKEFEEEVLRTEPDYDNVVGQDSLNRFDNKFKSKNKKKKRNSNNPQNPQGNVQNHQAKNNNNQQQKPVAETKNQAVVTKAPNPNQQQNKVTNDAQNPANGEVKKNKNKRRFNKKPKNNSNNPKPE